jgi:mono/diheme cytochrome c family protein
MPASGQALYRYRKQGDILRNLLIALCIIVLIPVLLIGGLLATMMRFNRDGDISGRPVDVAQGPDGAIYISDDYAGAIYRVSYDGSAAGASDTMVGSAAAIRGLDASPQAWLADEELALRARRGAALYQQHNCVSCHEQGANPALLSEQPAPAPRLCRGDRCAAGATIAHAGVPPRTGAAA